MKTETFYVDRFETHHDIERIENWVGPRAQAVDHLRLEQHRLLRISTLDRSLRTELATRFTTVRVTSADSKPVLGSRELHEDSVVSVGEVAVGACELAIIAGPCAIEGAEVLSEVAEGVRESGVGILRGGAFKPRTSPYAFQGTKLTGLRRMRDAADQHGLAAVSEVVDPRDVEAMAPLTDMFQIGTRNAQNFSLLTEVGRSGKPVLLKRGFGCTVDEWLGAAEYILAEGNDQVVLCERGVRTFESSTRFTIDISAIPVVKSKSRLPVIVDPSHGTGHRSLVRPMALAAVAAGADGLLLDVHTRPEETQCDGPQALTLTELNELVDSATAIHNLVTSAPFQPQLEGAFA